MFFSFVQLIEMSIDAVLILNVAIPIFLYFYFFWFFCYDMETISDMVLKETKKKKKKTKKEGTTDWKTMVDNRDGNEHRSEAKGAISQGDGVP